MTWLLALPARLRLALVVIALALVGAVITYAAGRRDQAAQAHARAYSVCVMDLP